MVLFGGTPYTTPADNCPAVLIHPSRTIVRNPLSLGPQKKCNNNVVAEKREVDLPRSRLPWLESRGAWK